MSAPAKTRGEEPPIPTFAGFGPECLEFFAELGRNNRKAWFESNRERYETHVLAPARSLVVALGARLKTIAPGAHAEPQVNRSIFRLFRDTRFSRDKTPYKTHLGLWFWEGNGPRMECSGFYFHLEPGMILLGAGLYRFPEQMLEHYRQSLLHRRHGPALDKALDAVLSKGRYHLYGERYKKVPRGYPEDHPRAELLRHDGLSVFCEEAVVPSLFSSRLPDWCLRRFQDMLPVHRWVKGLVDRAQAEVIEAGVMDGLALEMAPRAPAKGRGRR